MEEIFFTPSNVMEHLFCPRFTYFMQVMRVPQHEEKREKVLAGRNIHERKAEENAGYLRKRLDVKEKIIEPYLVSPRYHLKGIVDEVLITGSGEYIVLDYKFAEYKEVLFDTYKTQLSIYGLCIRDIYQAEMVRGFIVFTRSSNKLVEVPLSKDDYRKVAVILNEMLEIIQAEMYPKGKRSRNKCMDCTYRKLCV
ncbi:MAG: CRISPR-associated protein Cas4 [Spirochaetes bacterium GWF1_49_6]|nr:MAG: CRISPR-associated protein Cas4 [Spirochaetes bacterium GWF1_49_6]